MARRIQDSPGLFDVLPAYTHPKQIISLCGDTSVVCRYYQRDIVAGCWQRLVHDGFDSVLVVAATGVGKTVSAAFAAREWIDSISARLHRSANVLFLAHRDELIKQTFETMRAVCPSIRIEVEQSSSYAHRPRPQDDPIIVIASVQTISLKHRLETFSRDTFGQVITDEAHHAAYANNSYQCIYNHFQNTKHIGMTATPDRTDEAALGQTFASSLERNYDIVWGKEDGWLVPVVAEMSFISSLDLSSVRPNGHGDLSEKDLAAQLKKEGPLAGVVRPTIDAANVKNQWWTGRPRQAIIFASSVEHAALMAEMINDEHRLHGTGKAAVIYSKAKGMRKMEPEERREIVKAYRDGEITYLSNYGCLTEGFDAPETKIITIARPTKSRALYSQMVGRASRPHPNIVPALNVCETAAGRRAIIAASSKPGMLLIDPIGLSGKHKLITALDVLGGRYSDEIINTAKAIVKKSGGRMPVDKALEEAKKQREDEIKTQRKAIVYEVEYSKKRIDPFDVLDTVVDREPGWFKGKSMTKGQRAMLEKAGFKHKDLEGMGFFKASKAIEALIKRRKEGKCTYAQARQLLKYGYSVDTSFEDAKKIIDDLVSQGWPSPKDYQRAN